MNDRLKREIKRKAFHMLSALYMVLFLWAGRVPALWTLGLLTVAVGALEAVRLRNPAFNEALVRAFGGIHRVEETKRPSGILWTLAGSFFTVLLVPHPDVTAACLGYLAFGDAAAGLVGGGWGHIRLGAKSLEGSLACFLTCWFVGATALSSPFGSVEVLLGALAAALAELLPLPLNDNFWMPLLPGLLLSLLRSAAG